MKREKENEGPETAEDEATTWEEALKTARAAIFEEFRPLKDVPKAVLWRGVLLYAGIPVDQMAAWPPTLAARMIGLSYQTVKKDIDKGLLPLSPNGLVSRESMNKFLRGETGRSRK